MKKAKIFVHEAWAGILTEDDEGYHFQYNQSYLENKYAEPVSLTLPMMAETYHSKMLFPFFDGLIPEGWLLEIMEKNWKLNARDRMSVLLAACKDCIGAISVEPLE